MNPFKKIRTLTISALSTFVSITQTIQGEQFEVHIANPEDEHTICNDNEHRINLKFKKLLIIKKADNNSNCEVTVEVENTSQYQPIEQLENIGIRINEKDNFSELFDMKVKIELNQPIDPFQTSTITITKEMYTILSSESIPYDNAKQKLKGKQMEISVADFNNPRNVSNPKNNQQNGTGKSNTNGTGGSDTNGTPPKNAGNPKNKKQRGTGGLGTNKTPPNNEGGGGSGTNGTPPKNDTKPWYQKTSNQIIGGSTLLIISLLAIYTLTSHTKRKRLLTSSTKTSNRIQEEEYDDEYDDWDD